MTQSANRFDFIRLFFAAGVFVYHAVALARLDGSGDWESGLSYFAEVSIQGFFIVSGLLVAGSLDRSSGLADYAGKRVRRLYPAYAVVILIPALISLLWTGNIEGVGRYLAANLVFLNFLSPELPGLFSANRFPEVNGALWTLKIEVMFYLSLPLILPILNRLKALWWVGVLVLYVGV